MEFQVNVKSQSELDISGHETCMFDPELDNKGLREDVQRIGRREGKLDLFMKGR